MNFLIWLGGFIGLLSGGWRGLLIGALIGLALGRLLPLLVVRFAVGKINEVQSLFLDSTFAVMGAMSKADGRVSAEEIRAVEALFDQLRLSGEARDAAKASFNRGKSPGFDLDAEVARFAAAARGQRVLHQMFLQMQLAALAADGQIHPAEHALLVRVARGLGLSETELQALEAMLRGGGGDGFSGGGASSASQASALDDAYRVIGVEPSASDAELKRAYRKLMSENHPDKLAGKGLPESMRAMAEQKTRAITAAYDRIEKARRAAAA
jgi:DnaJ like chaperone protein